MKKCPKCSRVYADEALNFCLDDGEWLAPFEANEPVTAILSGDPVKEAQTRRQLTITDPVAESNLVAPSNRSWWRMPAIIAPVVIVVLIAAGLGIYKLSARSNSTKTLSLESAKISRLTNTGKVTNAAISPDGKYVAYVQDEGGQQSLWLRQTNTQSNVEIVQPAEVSYYGVTFTPDGDHIYYGTFEKADYTGALYEVSTLGSTPRKLLGDISSPVTFSPDGKQIAFIRVSSTEKKQTLLIADADGKNERVLAERGGTEVISEDSTNNLAWSPDGQLIAAPFGNIDDNKMTIVTISVSDGTTKFFTSRKWLFVTQIAWLADGGLLVTASDEGFSPAQIWRVAYPSGDVERVTNDLNNYQTISVAAHSGSLVTVQQERTANLWVTTPKDATAHATQVTSGRNNMHGVSWAPDGRIAYASMAGGNMDIWLSDAQGRSPKQLTTGARYNAAPFVTPDGRYIVFWSDRTGATRLWRMDIDGANQTPLTDGPADFPAASPDSRWVFYVAYESVIPTIWRVSIDGGQPVRITDKTSTAPVLSPDGKQVACYFQEKPGVWSLAILPFDGGQPVKVFSLPDVTRPALRFTPDGRALVYPITREGVTNLWEQSLDGSPPRQLTDFKSDGVFYFDFSRDGKQLALARGTRTRDVVLISDFWK